MQELTVRQYANKEKIALQTAYRRIYEGRVPAHQVMGRYWVVRLDGGLKPAANLGPGTEMTADIAEQLFDTTQGK